MTKKELKMILKNIDFYKSMYKCEENYVEDKCGVYHGFFNDVKENHPALDNPKIPNTIGKLLHVTPEFVTKYSYKAFHDVSVENWLVYHFLYEIYNDTNMIWTKTSTRIALSKKEKRQKVLYDYTCTYLDPHTNMYRTLILCNSYHIDYDDEVTNENTYHLALADCDDFENSIIHIAQINASNKNPVSDILRQTINKFKGTARPLNWPLVDDVIYYYTDGYGYSKTSFGIDTKAMYPMLYLINRKETVL